MFGDILWVLIYVFTAGCVYAIYAKLPEEVIVRHPIWVAYVLVFLAPGILILFSIGFAFLAGIILVDRLGSLFGWADL